MIGKTLAHYTILEKIGEGGMGVVYKARDTHLDRFVAIKLLPQDRVDDPERRRRFVQEAKAASALNHPNIVTVYDIATADGVTYIAMEYVAGQPLDAILARKGVRLNEALGYAVQIADALSAAHAAGIVHRDLKPPNIMVGDDGRVRVLDFGLAKLTAPVETDGSMPTATRGPLSEAGAIVGTVAYMSPEQAEGKPVDARSDIFSFGIVLYEMLALRHPFGRESRISTMAAIVNENPPPLSGDSRPFPPEVDRAVMRCLRKEPHRRWQSFSDLRSLLEDLKAESDSGSLGRAASPAPRNRDRTWLVGGLLALVFLVIAGGGYFWLRGRVPVATSDPGLVPLTLDVGLTGLANIGFDGKIIAYTSDRSGGEFPDIWIRHIDRPQPVRRTRDASASSMPAVSPDGSRIVYRSDRDGGSLCIMDTLGGDERKLVSGGVYRPRFSPDGKWILYTVMAAADSSNNQSMLVSVDGGEPRQLHPGFVADPEPGGAGPIWAPDSRRVLFGGARTADRVHGWWIATINGGTSVAVDTSVLEKGPMLVRFPSAWPWDDTLIYAEGLTIEGINLYRIGVSTDSLRLVGQPERLTSGPGLRYDASVASDGRLVFSILNWVSNVWTAALDPKTGVATGEPQAVTSDAQTKRDLSVSADGSKAAFATFGAFERGVGLHVDLKLRDLVTGRESVVASGALMASRARLSADGARLAYREPTPKGSVSLVWTPNGDKRLVCADCRVLGFFPQPDEMLVVAGGPSRLVRHDLKTGTEALLIAPTSGNIVNGRVSNDGRWVAFIVDKADGSSGLYVAPLRPVAVPEAEWVPVEQSQTARLADPCWSTDGGFLYYLSARDGLLCVWARRFDPETGRLAGDSFAALHLHSARHNLLGGGRWLWGLNATRDRLYILMATITGNVWTTKLKH